MILLNTAI